MSGKTKVTGEVVCKYLSQYPLESTRKVADRIFRNEVHLFNSFEHARETVRNYRGQKGVFLREAMKNRQFYVPHSDPSLPKSESIQWLPFIVDGKINNTLVIADVHVPYHIERAVEIALDYGVKRKVDSVLINGDFGDFYGISRFKKRPDKAFLAPEIYQLNQTLDWISKRLPKAQIIFKYGNHDTRLDSYVMIKSPELYQLPGLNLTCQLRLMERGVKGVEEQRIVHYGHLRFTHGDEWNGGQANPVGPARAVALKGRQSIVTAHSHKSGTFAFHNLDDDSFNCWSIGCLCELHPQYARLNEWNHGFGIAQKDETRFQYENFMIGKVGGKMEALRS